ncbi:MAG: aspartate aminotransferase family protein [Verrucomicrobiae bacterium]|nr:aspartate aminotransferase family protein [Verrucomicrobiae bacterium]
MALPQLRTRIPGPRSRALARRLHQFESRNVTFISENWPIFWQRARGANVWDVDGNRYLDLTAAFGVANVGHCNPRVVAAVRRQARELLHAMGDVHPNELKLQLARQLVGLTFGRWLRPFPNLRISWNDRLTKSSNSHRRSPGKVLFTNTGAEAVEAALKTAAIHTGKPGVITFQGAYHGLTYGALAATSREFFRAPFTAQLGRFVRHLPYGTIPKAADNCGAVLVEPIQGRGGMRVPPDDFLPGLRRFCDEHGLLLILDEVYTGFCRTGRWFACEHWGVVPDIICVGKALGGGLPISACIGKASVMDSWPPSEGEAIHTSTFMGHPVGCAAGVAALREMQRLNLPVRAAALGALAQRCLPDLEGKGLMLGLTVRGADRLCQQLLQRGILVLPEGDQNNRLAITPPLTISARQLEWALRQIAAVL